MTFDELVQAFDKAYCEKLDDAEGTRAGVRAVVVALRDAVIPWHVANDHRYWALELVRKEFREILGSDAGAGKVAGGATRKDVLDGGAARTVTQVPGSPATAPAPAERSDATAVCEWKHLWKDTEWRSCRPHAGGFYKGDWKDGDPCPCCKAPIKFTEAK